MVGETGSDTGWWYLADNDVATPLIATILELDVDEEYTKTELGDAAGVGRKALYLSGVVEDVVELGLLEPREREGGETTYAVVEDSPVYDAAAAFDEVATRSRPVESA